MLGWLKRGECVCGGVVRKVVDPIHISLVDSPPRYVSAIYEGTPTEPHLKCQMIESLPSQPMFSWAPHNRLLLKM